MKFVILTETDIIEFMIPSLLFLVKMMWYCITHGLTRFSWCQSTTVLISNTVNAATNIMIRGGKYTNSVLK